MYGPRPSVALNCRGMATFVQAHAENKDLLTNLWRSIPPYSKMTKRDLIFTGIGGGLTTLTKRTTLGWLRRLRIEISLRIRRASVFEMKTSSIRLMATTSCVCWSFALQTHLRSRHCKINGIVHGNHKNRTTNVNHNGSTVPVSASAKDVLKFISSVQSNPLFPFDGVNAILLQKHGHEDSYCRPNYSGASNPAFF